MPQQRDLRVTIVAASLDILGGQAVQAQSLFNALRGDGRAVSFLPINPRFPHGLRRLRQVPYLRTLVNQTLYGPSLARLAWSDVVHLFSGSYWSFLLAPVPAMVAARAMGKRVVLHYHSGEADDHLSNWGPLVHRWLRLAHAIVVPSEYLLEVFARHGYEAHVIPNIVDVSRFRYRIRDPLRPHLLSTRHLEPYYRVDVVLDAFARFRAQEPAATLTVGGHGSEETRLRRFAANVAGNPIHFAGKLNPAVMPRLYDRADIFVNASVVNNQPVSVLEAFAAGLPVVSTGTGDLRFMIRHGETGLLVPPGNPAALAAAIGELWRNPARARSLAHRARQEVVRYTWPAVRQLWNRIYMHAVSPGLHRSSGVAVPGPELQVRQQEQ